MASWGPKRPWWVVAGQFLLGIALVGMVGGAIALFWPRPKVPPGWHVLRPPNDVMALALYDGALWAGGRDGLAVVVLQTMQVRAAPGDGVPRGLVNALVIGPAGHELWVGHVGGLSRYDGRTWRTWTKADGLIDNEVLALAWDPVGGLWIGTAHGLSRWQDGRWTHVTRTTGLGGEAVSVIFRDTVGRWWFGNGYSTEGGLTCFDGEDWRTYTTADGLAHPMVNAIAEEPGGPLWFGTGFASHGGLTAFDGVRWWTLTVADGLAGPKVRSLFFDSQGGFWVGSEYDGIARRTVEGWRVLTPHDGLSGWEVKAMLEDSEGNLWLGTENGLTRLERVVWQQ